ncbi:hypothetical protein K0M31_000368 [Melipona bicolor]|uniref:Uncharacterized protein n=1 Tax=Melipona bicolor TaxID=60889 RepID=A0AA40GDM0_9HYME|nr:hypothetical protein K0M31_000368 [Melipona bicolor]
MKLIAFTRGKTSVISFPFDVIKLSIDDVSVNIRKTSTKKNEDEPFADIELVAGKKESANGKGRRCGGCERINSEYFEAYNYDLFAFNAMVGVEEQPTSYRNRDRLVLRRSEFGIRNSTSH